MGKFGPHRGGSCGGQGGSIVLCGAKGRYVVVPDKKQKVYIMNGMILLRLLSDAMIKIQNTVAQQFYMIQISAPVHIVTTVD